MIYSNLVTYILFIQKGLTVTKLPLFVSILLALFLTGCASPTVETRLSTDLSAYEYNDLSSQYMSRPTFVTVESVDSLKILHLTTNEYGKVGYDPQKVKHIFFTKPNVDGYVKLIDKYLEWETLATTRGDQISKNIGNVDGHHNLYFNFFSGNASDHYLVISTVASGAELWPVYFPKSEVIKLRKLLLDFKEDKFQKTDMSVYQ